MRLNSSSSGGRAHLHWLKIKMTAHIAFSNLETATREALRMRRYEQTSVKTSDTVREAV